VSTPGPARPSAFGVDFFVLRTPLLPYDDLATPSAGPRAPAALDGDDAGLASALEEDRARLRARLAALVERPEVREALFIASPDLDRGLEEWRRDPDGRRGRRAEHALVRYVARMATRSTPFGLFAGCAVGEIGEETRLAVPPRARYRRHTRLDMDYLCALIAALERDPAMRGALRYRRSSGLYRLAGRLRWVELTPTDPRHSHRQRRLDAGMTAALLDHADDGVTLGARVAGPDLAALVDRQVLVSELQPAATGPEPIHGLIARLREIGERAPAARVAANALDEARAALDGIDDGGIGADPARYRAVAALLSPLPGAVEPARLFQAELIKTVDEPGSDRPVLGRDVLREIERGVEILRRFARSPRDTLGQFREAFVSRYEGAEAGREIPLVEALDPDLGLGFGRSTGHDDGTPLLDGLGFSGASDERGVRWGARQTFLLGKLSDALSCGAREIQLDDADLDRLASPEPPPLPDAFSASAVLAAASPEALARGEFRVLLQGVAGPSGARLLGRFCHGDPILRGCVERHVRAEEALRPDTVFAEIAHLPEPRAGNILHRPVFRAYEIAYLGVSGAPMERQIPITDLLVSVVDGRVVLRSARLGREVVPRLTCAQNYFHPRTTPIYRFLAALQDQGVATGLGWDWGPLADAPFLPRVAVGRLVLARAQWTMGADEARVFERSSGAEQFRAVRAWRERRGVPRHVRLVDHDDELLIDFDNVLSVESLAQLLQGRARTVLAEALPGPDELCATGRDGRFFHELTVPFVRVEPPDVRGEGHGHDSAGGPGAGPVPPSGGADAAGGPRPSAASSPRPAAPGLRAPRSFRPGSEWLYAKLYTGPAQADQVLREVVRPIVDRALGSGAADRWFFLRYGDPLWHLRLRFHGDPARLLTVVAPAIEEAVGRHVEEGGIRGVQFESYEREVERYGGPGGVVLAEQLSEADSLAVLEIVEAFDDDALADARWRLALPGMDLLLEGLGFDLEGKLAVARAIRDAFAREHRADHRLNRQLGERYRAERAALAPLLDPERRTADGPLGPGFAALGRRSERSAPVMAELRRAAGERRLTIPIADLARSYLHLHANRLLRSDQRRQELVLYDFLYRLYDGQAARARTAPPVVAARPREPAAGTGS